MNSYRRSVNDVEQCAHTTSTVGAVGVHAGEHQRAFRCATGLGSPQVSHSRTAALSRAVVSFEQRFVQNIRTAPFRAAFATSYRGRWNVVMHPPHVRSTTSGSEEAVTGGQIDSGGVAAAGDVDAVVVGADDAAATGREDLDERPVRDRAGRDDGLPLRCTGGVVDGEHAGTLGGFVEITDLNVAAIGQDERIATQAVNGSTRQGAADAGAVDAAPLADDAPLVGGRVGLHGDVHLVAVGDDVVADHFAPAAGDALRVRHDRDTHRRVVREHPRREPTRHPLRLALLRGHRHHHPRALASFHVGEDAVDDVQRRGLDRRRVEGGGELAGVGPALRSGGELCAGLLPCGAHVQQVCHR